MSKKATEELLGELHGAIAREFLNQIKAGGCTASLLKEAAAFLKDNGISADPGAGDPASVLAGADNELDDGLPFPAKVAQGLNRLVS